MYLNISRHPQIQELPGKELKVLNGGRSRKQKAARVARWTARWQRKYARKPKQLEWGLKWLERYSQQEDGLESYLTLFDTPAGTLSGDMSPNFCWMPPAKVRDIRSRLGDIRVFMLARDPIERDWSDAQLALQYRKTALQKSDDEYIKYISSRDCQRFSNYLDIIDVWSKYFNNFRVFYFDEIVTKPQKLMEDVFKFLNIDQRPKGYKVREMAAGATSIEVGEFVRTRQIYEAQKRISKPLMAELKIRLGGHPAVWYDRHFGSTVPLDAPLVSGELHG
jgi:hypothetical protein